LLLERAKPTSQILAYALRISYTLALLNIFVEDFLIGALP
jgi:hypothetical protein